METKREVDMMKLDDLKGIMEKQFAGEKVHKLSLGDLDWVGTEKDGEVFKYDGKNYMAPDGSFEALCGCMGVPSSFFHRCNDVTKRAVANQFLKVTKPIQLVTSNSHIEAILSDKATYVSPLATLDVAAKVLPKAEAVSFKRSAGRVFLELVTNEQKAPPKKVGDVTRAGVEFSIGRQGYTDWSVELSAYLYTLRCTNGMISADTERFIVRGQSEGEVIKQFGDMLKRVYESSVNQMLPRFIHTDDIRINDPANVVNQMANQNGLPNRLKNVVINRIPELGQNPTLYEVIGLITNTANQFDRPRASRQMRMFGGFVNKTHDHRCPNCQSSL